MASSPYSGMGLSSSLHDLSLVMDSNIHTSSFLFPSVTSSIDAPSPLFSGDESETESSPTAEPDNNISTSPPPLPLFPLSCFPGTASLSFALSSAVATNPLLSKANFSLARPTGVSPSPSPSPSPLLSPSLSSSLSPPLSAKKSSSTSTSTPSQTQCHAPIKVMASSKVAKLQQDMTGLDKSTKLFKNFSSDMASFPDLVRLPSGYGSSSPSNFASGMRKSVVMWFRNDLRIHDNEALASANNDSLSVLPVYCFDPRDYGKSSSGFDKTGPYRAKFLLECVSDLRSSLRARGSDLIVRVGRPEEVLPQLVKAVGADALYAHQEVTYEEVQAESKVSAALKEEGIETRFFWGSTLYHIDDLPFQSLEEMPANYAGFKDKTKAIKVRSTSEVPEKLKTVPSRGGVKAGKIPSLQDLGITSAAKGQQENAHGGSALIGGESEALERLKRFVAEASAQSQRQTGNKTESLIGASFSCKISPWLAMGCLSPRRMFQDLQSNVRGTPVASAEGTLDEKSGLNWLVFELLWRDFFRFITKKYGSSTRKGAPATASAAMAAV